MDDNPYEPPKTAISSPDAASRVADLQQLAADFAMTNGQLIFSLSVHFLTLIFLFLQPAGMLFRLAPTDTPPGAIQVIWVIVSLVAATGIGLRHYPWLVGLLMAALSIVPCISPLVWFIFRRRVVALLEDERVHVGFLLVDPRSLAARIQQLANSGEPQKPGLG